MHTTTKGHHMTLSPKDPFVILSGGLILSDPELPVFDMDVLQVEDADSDTWLEVTDLCGRLIAQIEITETSSQRRMLQEQVDACERWLAVSDDLKPEG
jgi:hypothetical protein